MITTLEMLESGSNSQERSAVAPRTTRTGLEGTVTLKESGEKKDYTERQFGGSTNLHIQQHVHVHKLSKKINIPFLGHCTNFVIIL